MRLIPPTTRLTEARLAARRRVPLMILGLDRCGAAVCALLYPLVIVQIGLLVNRIPQYATLLQGRARELLTHLQENFGPEVVNDKLRDLVSGQAGSMLSILLSTVTGVIGGGFAIFNLFSLAVVTPVVGFYLLRAWPAMVWMVDCGCRSGFGM